MSSATSKSLRDRANDLIDHPIFTNFILFVIVINSISLGLQTSESYKTLSILEEFDQIAIAIFVFELLLKLYGRGLNFFKSGWNLFDFVIVSMALVPEAGQLSVLRAFRILRALRLVSAVPQMRRVIQTLIQAIPGMLSVAGLIGLFFYIGAVLTTNLYGPDFPQWFGSIGSSMFSLFQIMTLESWSMGIVRPVMELHPMAWAFFVPFILVTTFAVLNLFIGILVDGMQNPVDENGVAEPSEIDLLRAEVAEIKAILTASKGGKA